MNLYVIPLSAYGELSQHPPLPGALGEDAGRDLDVEARLQQDGLPLNLQAGRRRHLYTHTPLLSGLFKT